MLTFELMMTDYEKPIEAYFEKRFSFNKETIWLLPPLNEVYKNDLWVLPVMQEMKKDLNDMKSLLNDKGEVWHDHTFHINKAGLVMVYIRSLTNVEILTQAWCKFYEILSYYCLIPENTRNLSSLHLCEAPGAFISALNHYLFTNYPKISWQWIANSLNPYYEGHNIKNVVVDDRLLFPTLKNWYFGLKDTGDITDSEYIEDLLTFLKDREPISLITADGSINCLENPEEQEIITSELQMKEVLIALLSLSLKGTLVLKQFTFFECVTICKIYLLACLFEKVHIFKPFTSRAGNSEVYVICLGFLGSQSIKEYVLKLFEKCKSNKNMAIFPLSSIPESFLSQLSTCSRYFMTFQKEAIEENLQLFSGEQLEYEERLDDLKHLCAKHYINKCNLTTNDSYDSAHLFSKKKQIKSSFCDKQNTDCKKLFFRVVGETYENLSKYKSFSWKEKIQDIDKRLNECFPISCKRHCVDKEWIPVWKVITKRMKSKSYENWFSSGLKVKALENSKFCNPMLIFLWNKISYCSQINWDDHADKTYSSWDLDNIDLFLEEAYDKDFSIILISYSKNCSAEDSLWLHLRKEFPNFQSHNWTLFDEKLNSLPDKKVIYVNTTFWIKSLHQETTVKNCLISLFCNLLKELKKGDFLIISIQSLLMRFTVGLIFILLSLFEKFTCLLPSSVAGANSGQLWIFNNFQKPEWTEQAAKHLEKISKLFNFHESKEILQIVPISSLCSSPFYEFLLYLNNDHMLQRLRSLISREINKS